MLFEDMTLCEFKAYEFCIFVFHYIDFLGPECKDMKFAQKITTTDTKF